MKLADEYKLMRATKHLHTKWYTEAYPEVAALGMEPAAHYRRYGAAMGRNPGKNFDTRYYVNTYPEVAESGMNPLLHYALIGRDKGYAVRASKDDTRNEIFGIRTKLLSLGFTDQPLAELRAIYEASTDPEIRALTARELALWSMREKTEESYRKALIHIAEARAERPDLDFRTKLATAELLCHYFLGNTEAGYAAYERAALAGEMTPDLMLALVNFQTSPAGRIAWMNQVLRHYNIAPVALMPDSGQPLYDRMISAVDLPAVTDGPLVTVLIAAYEAADVLPTALRSLQEQTWKNLEIIVLDDCSPSPGTREVAESFAATDPRIRVIRMEQNGGAYVARNRGLDEATGVYVTLHDADDWSHPTKIEMQVRFLEEHPEIMGCTSEQARMTSEMFFPKWAGAHSSLKIIKENVSSFMQRHKPVFEAVGHWDSVRFGADSERMRRIRHAFGNDSVKGMETGPLSFQRISETSIVADDAFGVDGYFFGARLEYFEGQLLKNQEDVLYGNRRKTNFPVPVVMRADRAKFSPHYNVIIGSEFRMHGGSTRSNVEEMVCHKRFGVKTGVFQMYRYDYPTNSKRMLPEVRDELDDNLCVPLAYGEKASCDLLILRYPPVLQYRHRYIPKIDAKHIKVIINQPPMSDYTEEGVVRYDLAKCAENVRGYFGKDAVWHPIGPLVRQALHEHHSDQLGSIDLSPEDWNNIIDIAGWERGPRKRGPKDRLRIGRHSRDSEHKWPHRKEDILAVYPDADDVEIHVLGGATSPAAVIGGVPKNWTVHEFGSMHPREFLADVDVFVYFAHPDWVEAFGRTIIEAMAVGVPVILPEIYRPLFGDAALYATPETAVEMARRIHADPKAYDAQVKLALDSVRTRFSYEMHLDRLRALGAMDANP